MSSGGRAERILEVEQRFRAINDRLKADLLRLPESLEPVGFVCECGDAACDRTVQLTLAEYDAAHAEPNRFLVEPGHEIPDVEEILERRDGWFVIRKLG